MHIKTIDVSVCDLRGIFNDPSVYVIKKYHFSEGHAMIPIKNADVKDLLDENALIIKILE